MAAWDTLNPEEGKKVCYEGGDTVLYQVLEAELWGVHSDLLITDDLEVSQAVGLYGTLYQITCRSLWTFWRLTDYISRLLPPDARLRFFPADEDEDLDGVLILHYWEEARSRIKTSAAGRPPIRKPSN